MEGGRVAGEGGARPGVAAEVERVLVTLCFIFVLKAVAAVGAFVLLFLFVRVEFFCGVEFLRLLGTAFADEDALHFRSTVVLCVSYAVGKFAGGHQRSSFR